MDMIVLSKVGGILGPFALILGLIMNFIYEVLGFSGDTKCCFGDYIIYINHQPFNVTIDD